METLLPVSLPANGSTVIRNLLSYEQAQVLANDFHERTSDYKACFNGLIGVSNVGLVDVPITSQEDIPAPLVELTDKLLDIADDFPKPVTKIDYDVVINGKGSTEAHTDSLSKTSYSFIIVAAGGMFCEYGGKLKYAGTDSPKLSYIQGGKGEHLQTGSALVLDNTSHYKFRRPPHYTSKGSNCLRFVIDLHVSRLPLQRRRVVKWSPKY